MPAAPDWLTARPVAHRGLHGSWTGHLENTLPAFAAAAGRGFAIECDVALSADGAVMVFHDDTLDRLTTAAGPLAARTAASLQTLPLKGSDANIPTLAELLALVDGRVPLVIELKSDGRPDSALPAKVGDLLAAYQGHAAVMSFDPNLVKALKTAAPDRPRGLISWPYTEENAGLSGVRRFVLRHMLPALADRPDFIAYDVRALPSSGPGLLRMSGLPLLTWTVRDAAGRATARRHADQMIFEGFDPDA